MPGLDMLWSLPRKRYASPAAEQVELALRVSLGGLASGALGRPHAVAGIVGGIGVVGGLASGALGRPHAVAGIVGGIGVVGRRITGALAGMTAVAGVLTRAPVIRLP